MKRFYFWSLLISLIFILIGVIWFFFFKTINTPPLVRGSGGLPGSEAHTGGRGGKGTSTPIDGNAPYVYISPLQKIWNKPVAGFSFEVIPIIITSTSTNDKGQEITTQTRATTTYLFFVEKATGNIYKKDFSTGRIIRVTNTTIPAVQDATFLKNGSVVVIQTYNKDTNKIEVFIADVPQTESENSPLSLGNPTLLQDNISSFVRSFDGSSLYYLVPNQKGSTLYRYTKEKSSSFIESYPLKEVTLSVTNKDVYLASKPSTFVPGYIFRAQPFVAFYGGKTGFSLNPAPTSPISIVSMWSNTGLFSYVHSLIDGKDYVLKDTFLAEKCSWNIVSTFAFCAGDSNPFIGEEGLPDVWYKGDISFTDKLYSVKNSGGVFNSDDLLDMSTEAKEPIDLIKPDFDDSIRYFSFINKKDGALWLLDVVRVLNQ